MLKNVFGKKLENEIYYDREAAYVVLIDKDKIAFNGEIECHSDSKAIIDFLNKYKIKPVELKKGRLEDIGRIDGALCRTCTDNGMKFINKQNNISIAFIYFF